MVMESASENTKQSDFPWVVRVYAIAFGIIALDQLTKWIIHTNLEFRREEIDVIDGFFRIVYWGNTGSAFSMFSGQNHILAIIAFVAVVGIYFFRQHFEIHFSLGRWSMGLITGGIIGNLIDRIVHDYVVDFIYFYTYRKSGSELVSEIGFPAFNIADTAICTGIGLMFLLSARVARKEALAAEKTRQNEDNSESGSESKASAD